jgi:hypothetical protein
VISVSLGPGARNVDFNTNVAALPKIIVNPITDITRTAACFDNSVSAILSYFSCSREKKHCPMSFCHDGVDKPYIAPVIGSECGYLGLLKYSSDRDCFVARGAPRNDISPIWFQLRPMA